MESENIDPKQFLEAAAYLLRETFEGAIEGQPSAYLDAGVGMFATLDGISADAASADFNGTTIAAQTEHAKFYLDRICEYMGGRTTPVNWEDSWLIETVSDEEWTALRSTVRVSYESALRCLVSITEWDEKKVGMVFGLIAHSAYHLGSMRQIAKEVGK